MIYSERKQLHVNYISLKLGEGEEKGRKKIKKGDTTFNFC